MSETQKSPKKTGGLYFITRAALMAALMCVLAPLAIPVGPVPLSLATLVIYLSLYILDWKMTCVSVLTYLLLGLVGLPVFSGFAGGAAKLLGPTGGYLMGYLPMALVSGLIMAKCHNKFVQFLALVLGTAVLYALGTAWYTYEAGVAWIPALSACVWPFIPGDLIKILAAMLVGPVIRRKLEKAGLLKG